MSNVFFSSRTAFANALGPCLIKVERKVPSGGNPCTEGSNIIPVQYKNEFEENELILSNSLQKQPLREKFNSRNWAFFVSIKMKVEK